MPCDCFLIAYNSSTVASAAADSAYLYCIQMIQIPPQHKTTTPDGVVVLWRSERDLNPRALFRRLLP